MSVLAIAEILIPRVFGHVVFLSIIEGCSCSLY